jgi:transcriptional regulator of nitric oxide reductase
MTKKHFLLCILIIFFCALTLASSIVAADDNNEKNAPPFATDGLQAGKIKGLISEIFPNATRIDKKDNNNHVWPIYVASQRVGYAFESKDFIQIQGFAGDSINLLIGIDNDGEIIGVRVLFQHEAIFMHGLGPEALESFLQQYPGHSVSERKQPKLLDASFNFTLLI